MADVTSGKWLASSSARRLSIFITFKHPSSYRLALDNDGYPNGELNGSTDGVCDDV